MTSPPGQQTAAIHISHEVKKTRKKSFDQLIEHSKTNSFLQKS